MPTLFARRLVRNGVTAVAGVICVCLNPAAYGQCEAQQLTSPAGDKGNLFGAGVAINGDLAVVGDSGVVDEPVGTASVFRYDGTRWVPEAHLRTPSKQELSDGFGRAVAIRGNVLVVGAPSAAAPEFQSGAVYIFHYDPDGLRWRHEATLTASDGDASDLFGFSVALDTDAGALLIGARDDENEGEHESGSAYVFRYNPDTSRWVEEAKLTDSEGRQLDAFGFVVAIKGDLALIGVPADDGAALHAGTAFMYRYEGTSWNLEAQLTAFDATSSDFFGWSVSLTADVALIGASQADSQTGAAYVFRFDPDSSAWQHEIKLVASDPVGPFPLFGSSVSLSPSAKTALIGAPSDFALGFESGAAHLFRHDATGWQEVIKLTASDSAGPDQFGTSVAVSDDIGLVGAHGQSESPGAAYVFDLDPTAGDLDCDGAVGIIDLLMLLAGWGPCPSGAGCAADLDNDGAVGILDLLTLLANWG